MGSSTKSQSDPLERSIRAYEAALTVADAEQFPADWADLKDQIGLAYAARLRGDREQNMEAAIQAHEEALEVFAAIGARGEWAACSGNLGLAYVNRLRGGKAANVETAIARFTDATTILTEDAHPMQWAGVQVNLADAYSERRRGGLAVNQEAAIAAYERAARVFERLDAREEWAKTKCNLGNSYFERIRGAKPENLDLSVRALREALGVFALEVYPRDHLNVARYLGETLISCRRWREALEAFRSAREAFTTLFGQGLDDDDVFDLLATASPAFVEASFAEIELGNPAGALEVLDDGKARLVAAALTQLNLPLSTGDRTRLDDLREAINALSRSLDDTANLDGVHRLDRLAAARAELRAIIEDGLRRSHPGGSLLSRLAATLPADAALVAPLAASLGGKVLIVSAAAGATTVDVLDVPGFTSKALTEILIGGARGDARSWRKAHQGGAGVARLREQIVASEDTARRQRLFVRHDAETRRWFRLIDEAARTLWAVLGTALRARLCELGADRAETRREWIPSRRWRR